MDCGRCGHARDAHSGGDVVLGNCWAAMCSCTGDDIWRERDTPAAVQFYEDFHLALKAANDARESRCPECETVSSEHWNACSYYLMRNPK